MEPGDGSSTPPWPARTTCPRRPTHRSVEGGTLSRPDRGRWSCWRLGGRRMRPRRPADDDRKRMAEPSHEPESPADLGGIERQRMAHAGHLEEGLDSASPWYQWGPYLSERAWGSVREDYSADGDAWASFPHDHARSRAYRWNEDGMAGISDLFGRLNLGARAVERPRPDPQGADVRADQQRGQPRRGRQGVLVVPRRAAQPRLAALALPLPPGGVPLRGPGRGERPALASCEPEYELLDTGIFDDDRYWIVEVDYAKADPTDILMRITRPQPRARGGRRSTCCRRCGSATSGRGTRHGRTRPSRRRPAGRAIHAVAPGARRVRARTSGPGPDGTRPSCCSARTRPTTRGSTATAATTPYPKDGINDHVVTGAATVNPAGTGTKAAAWYRLTVAARRDRRDPAPPAAEARRPPSRRGGDSPDLLGAAFDADDGGAPRRGRRLLRRPAAGPARPPTRRRVMRQAFAGMLWSKQFYALRRRPLARRRSREPAAAERAR